MTTLQIKGTQEFLGMNIPVIEGGFGPDQKVILAKTIAEIHGVELRYVNQVINRNLDEFEIGIDILDIKQDEKAAITICDSELYTSNSLNASKNVYLLSEQGYMALVQLMRTEKAKEIRKKLRCEYFSMRQVISSNENMKAQLLLAMYNGGAGAITAAQELSKMEVQEAVAPLVETIQEQAPKVEAFEDFMEHEEDSVDFKVLSTVLGVKKNAMLAFLRDQKILMTDSYYKDGKKKYGDRHNLPYAQYEKFFDVKYYSDECEFKKVKVKPSGQEYIRKQLTKHGFIEKRAA